MTRQNQLHVDDGREALRVLGDASDLELMHVQNLEDACTKVYLYDHQSRAVRHPEAGEVHWPILMLLASHSRKHIFCSKQLPNVQHVAKALRAFTHKVRWRWALRGGTEDPAGETLRRLKGRARQVRPCEELCPPELETWTHLFSEKVLAACKRSVALSRGREHKHSIFQH